MIGTWIVLIVSTVGFLLLAVSKPGKSIFDK